MKPLRHTQTAAGPGTRTLLSGLERRPEASWPALISRAESRLRVLLHFRRGELHRGVCDDDDLLQDLWTTAIARIDCFEYAGPGSLQRWLAGILRNKLRETARKRPRVQTPETSLAATGDGAPRDGLVAALLQTRGGASRGARQRELEQRVRQVLAKLPEPEREAVLMRLYEGLSVREAGALAGVDPSTITLRFQRALQRCARALRGFAP